MGYTILTRRTFKTTIEMSRDTDAFHYDSPDFGRDGEAVDAASPEDGAVVGGFQNLAAGVLSKLGAQLDVDVLLTSDNVEVKSHIADFVAELVGLRPLDVSKEIP